MNPEETHLKPLEEEEKHLLAEIYSKRRKLFISVFSLLIPIAVLSSFRTEARNRRTGQTIHFQSRNRGSDKYSPTTLILLNLTVMLSPICIVGAVVYSKRIYALKKDINAGVKQARLYQVTMKQVFEHTRQYFISTNDPKYLHHEVDAGTYDALSVGHFFAVYFAPHSGYVFNKNGRYTLM